MRSGGVRGWTDNPDLGGLRDNRIQQRAVRGRPVAGEPGDVEGQDQRKRHAEVNRRQGSPGIDATLAADEKVLDFVVEDEVLGDGVDRIARGFWLTKNVGTMAGESHNS